MSCFRVPAEGVHYEQLIKNSRFITFIQQAGSPTEAHVFIAQIRQQYPDARHVCWAFIAGQPGNTTLLGCSDDGEPAGTAGKPMLNVLLHGGVGEVVAVVVRYFGGIKLGTGGLVRAYSSSVVEALRLTPLRDKVETVPLRLEVPYPFEDVVRRHLGSHGVQLDDTSYGEQLLIACHCPADQLEILRATLRDAGRGQIVIVTPA
ncbi:MAG: YigZ family protein [Thiolinea sp.]